MDRVELRPSGMSDDEKQSIRESRPVQISGYEWAFTCSCGAVGKPQEGVTDESVIVCGDCGAEWTVSISHSDEGGDANA